MSDTIVPIEAILNYNKPKFALLSQWFGQPGNLLRSDTSAVRFFFDLDAITNHFFATHRQDQMEGMIKGKDLLLASDIISSAGHLRHFMWSRFGRYTDIFFVHSSKRPAAKVARKSGYLNEHYHKRLDDQEYSLPREYVNRNVTAATKIAEFLPNIHVIDGGEVDALLVPKILMKKVSPPNKGTMNMVISNRMPFFQYANEPMTVIGTWNGDRSKMVNFAGIPKFIQEKNKTKKHEYTFASELFEFALAMAGDKKFDVDGQLRMALPTAMHRLQLWSDEGVLTDETRDVDLFVEKTNTSQKPIPNVDQFRLAHYLLSVNAGMQDVTVADETAIENQVVNKRDWLGLKQLNEAKLNEYPLVFEYVLAGETYN